MGCCSQLIFPLHLVKPNTNIKYWPNTSPRLAMEPSKDDEFCTDGVVVLGTEEELSEFMAKHANVLTAADECEPLRDAGEAITDAFSSDPPRLYGELLLLCQKVVSASQHDDEIETNLQKVAEEAMGRAKHVRKMSPSRAEHTGMLTELFQNTCIQYHDQTSNWTVVSPPSEVPAQQKQQQASSQRRPPPAGQATTARRPQPQQKDSHRATWQGHRKRGLLDRFLEAIGSVSTSSTSPSSSSSEPKKNTQRTPIRAAPDLLERLVAMGFSHTGECNVM